MRRPLVLATAVLAAAVFLAPPAGAHTERELHAALDAIRATNAKQARRINALTAKLNCLGKLPVATFFDYAFYEPITIMQGNPPVGTSVMGDVGFPNYALAWTHGTGTPADAFMIAVRPTAACRAKFRTLRDPLATQRRSRSAEQRSAIIGAKRAMLR